MPCSPQNLANHFQVSHSSQDLAGTFPGPGAPLEVCLFRLNPAPLAPLPAELLAALSFSGPCRGCFCREVWVDRWALFLELKGLKVAGWEGVGTF